MAELSDQPAGLILASTSPRRRLLLEKHGFAHRAISPGIDDGVLRPGGVSQRAWVAAVAHLKARAALSSLEDAGEDASGCVLIASDTAVLKGDRVIGQPHDADDARAIISTLSGGSHEVVTAVAIAAGGCISWLVDASRVTVGEIGSDRIDAYVASDGWRGKAGGYNLMERIDDGWPIAFEGDETSIMGLPMVRLAPVLDRLLAAHAGGGRGVDGAWGTRGAV